MYWDGAGIPEWSRFDCRCLVKLVNCPQKWVYPLGGILRGRIFNHRYYHFLLTFSVCVLCFFFQTVGSLFVFSSPFELHCSLPSFS